MTDSKLSWLKMLNSRHAVIMHEGRCLILNEEKEGEKVTNIDLSRLQDFYGLYAPYTYEDEETKQSCPISKIWFSWKNRRIYRKGFCFAPGENSTGDRYNLWFGLSVEPKPGRWDLYQDHIYDVMANKDDDIYRWLLCWMARIVQDPGGEKPGTCIVLRGPQGTGKGTFATLFGKLFGDRHFYPITNEMHVTGRFNRHLATSLLVFLDEAIWQKRLMATAGMLKAIITEPRITMEEKFRTPITIPNFINVIIAGNDDWLVPAGIGERRFCVLDILPKRRNDHAYFQRIYDQMSRGGLNGMLNDLLQLDISQVNLRMIPKTAALFDQISQSFDSLEGFWFDCFTKEKIDSTRLNPMFSIDMTEASEAPKESIYKAYLEYCQDRKIQSVDVALFWKNSRKMAPIKDTRPRKANPERKGYCSLPPIEECRKYFSRFVGQDIEWSR